MWSPNQTSQGRPQVLRFQYLQKEVDLEIERREARKESQQEAKARKSLGLDLRDLRDL